MILGYNTNGFAFHRLEDAARIIAELGYGAIGLTLDVHHLDPYGPDIEARAAAFAGTLSRLGLRCVVETGARFLLDSRRKHQPTLLDPDPIERARRADFLLRALAVAEALQADALSFWSGAAPDSPGDAALAERFLSAFAPVMEAAAVQRVPLALEPEPGMWIATTKQGMEMIGRAGDANLGLTVDVGHVYCQREGDLPAVLRSTGDRLFNVHLDDSRRDAHDHLQFGEGEIDFPPAIAALKEIGFGRCACVELSRHAH
ncbi:MAG TPA: sugar phosphate isomerase/epimerase family protein, partial [Planctomycetia bacterium]|nr:sugar phosphate isomerase/epimerase family protein [Planctomycetia bacterium]